MSEDRSPRIRSGRRSAARLYEVMVVENDPDSLALLCEYLEHRGFRVRGYDVAESALVGIGEQAPDVVLTDVRLPGMSGVELARTVRSDPSTAWLPFVAISGDVEPGAAVRRAFQAYLRKPVELALLTDVVATLARGAREARHAG
jgi:CheY-like chemotaxis protein